MKNKFTIIKEKKYISNLNRKNRLTNQGLLLIVSLLFGTLYSVYLIGYIILPTETDWLFNNDDTSTYQIGWLYLRNDSWHWPLTFTEHLIYPTGTSISYTDSIPILAIVFKLFSNLLPENFQYFGIYLLFCFVMQFFWGAKLTSLFYKESDFLIIASGLLFMIAPPLTQRILHIPLSSHWLILASIWTYFACKTNQFPRRFSIFFLQVVIVFIASGINPYIAVMSLAFILITYLEKLVKHNVTVIQGLIVILFFISLLLFGWYLFGYFSSKSSSGNSYGFYSFNLISLFSSIPYSSFLSSFLQKNQTSYQLLTYQYEGFNYLGLGILLLLFTNLIVVSINGKKYLKSIFYIIKDYKLLIILLIFFTLFSLSHKIYWMDHLIFAYPLPEKIKNIMGSFRASGRFFWPVHYLILLSILILTMKLWTRNKIKILLILIISIQGLDLIALQSFIRFQLFNNLNYEVLSSPTWNQLSKHHKKLIIIPSYQCNQEAITRFPKFEKLAALQGLKTNSAYLGRYSTSQLKTHCVDLPKSVFEDNLESDAAYVLDKKTFWEVATNINSNSQHSHYCNEFDGFILCQKRLSPNDKGVVNFNAPTYVIGTQLSFTNSEQTSKYLFGDWSKIESGGMWTNGDKASLVMAIKPPILQNLMLNTKVHPFVSTQHPQQVVDIFVNGQKLSQWVFQYGNSQPTLQQVLIPAELINQKTPLTISFKILNPASPKSLGQSDDSRQLGLFFEMFQLNILKS